MIRKLCRIVKVTFQLVFTVGINLKMGKSKMIEARMRKQNVYLFAKKRMGHENMLYPLKCNKNAS